jgi:hypothetical protein
MATMEAMPETAVVWEQAHAHTAACYWDYLECRWVCPPAGTADPVSEP